MSPRDLFNAPVVALDLSRRGFMAFVGRRPLVYFGVEVDDTVSGTAVHVVARYHTPDISISVAEVVAVTLKDCGYAVERDGTFMRVTKP